MATELITKEEHERILQKIDDLSFGDEYAGVCRAALEELFNKFNTQLAAVFETIKAYREVTELVNRKKPLAGKKKEVRVRMRQGKTDD